MQLAATVHGGFPVAIIRVLTIDVASSSRGSVPMLGSRVHACVQEIHGCHQVVTPARPGTMASDVALANTYGEWVWCACVTYGECVVCVCICVAGGASRA